MKTIINLVALSLITILVMSLPLPGQAGPLPSNWSELAAEFQTTMDGVVEDVAANNANDGYEAVSTPTLTISSASATIVGTIPAGCHMIEVHNSGSYDVNYGPSNLSTSTAYPYIAAGASKEFTGLTSTTPKIYFRTRGTSTPTSDIGIIAK